LGRHVAALRDQFVYSGRRYDVAAMRAMRERQLRHLVTGGTLNVKFSPGGLVDVEYLVQGLQMTHGHDLPGLRSPNTREAMAALREAGLLGEADYERLRDGHNFLRQVINALRMVRGNARDMTVPATDSEEFAYLARRLGYGDDVSDLRDDLVRHTGAVREINARLLRPD
jgi:glutamate-ammonia-ligase adenylyltransferase